VIDFLVDKRDVLRWQFVVFAIGTILLVWFTAAFCTVMSRSDVSLPFVLLPLVAIAGIFGIGFGGGSEFAALIWRGATDMHASGVREAWDANALAGSFISIAAVVIFLAAAALIMRTRLLPMWLAWFALVGAVVNVLSMIGIVFDPDQTALAPGGAISVVGLMVTMLWILVTGVVMLRAEPA